MTEDTPNPQDEYAQVLLGKFSKRINLRVADLTGWPEIAESDDPQELIKEVLDNWPDHLEHLLPRYGVTFRLVDKVRRIRNDVRHDNGGFTRSEPVFRDAMRSVGLLEKRIRTAASQEGRRRQAVIVAAPASRGWWKGKVAIGTGMFIAGVLAGMLATALPLDSL